MHVVAYVFAVSLFSLALAYAVSSRKCRRVAATVVRPLLLVLFADAQRWARRLQDSRRPAQLTQRAKQRVASGKAGPTIGQSGPSSPSAKALGALDATTSHVAHLVGVLHAAAASNDDIAQALQLTELATALQRETDSECASLETALSKIEADCEDQLVELYLEVTCLEEEAKQRLRAAVAEQHARAAKRLRAAASRALARVATLPPGIVDVRSLNPPEEDADWNAAQTIGSVLGLRDGAALAPVSEHPVDDDALAAPPGTPPSPSVAAAAAVKAGGGALLMRASEVLRLRRGLPASSALPPGGGSVARGLFPKGDMTAGGRTAPLSPAASTGADDSDDSDADVAS
jgi:hypothetical protein